MKEWFLSLQPRERRLVLAGGLVAGLIILWGLLLAPLGRATAAAAERVARKERDLAWMHQAAGQIRAAGAGDRAAMPPSGPLVVIVDRTVRDFGLQSALANSQPTGADAIRVRFDNAAFDAIIEWLGRLHADHGLIISAATVDAGAQAGRVNASLVLERPAG